MKYLQKFNESKEDEDMKDYILMCFAEFTDDDKYGFEHEGYDEELYRKDGYDYIIDLLINVPENHIEGEINIEDALKDIDVIKEFYLDIDSCLKKVKDEYPKIEYEITKIIDEFIYLCIAFKIKI